MDEELNSIIGEIIDSSVSGELDGNMAKLNSFLAKYGYSLRRKHPPQAVQVAQQALPVVELCLALDSLAVSLGFLMAELRLFRNRAARALLLKNLDIIQAYVLVAIAVVRGSHDPLGLVQHVEFVKAACASMKDRVAPLPKRPNGNELSCRAERVRLDAMRAYYLIDGVKHLHPVAVFLDEIVGYMVLTRNYVDNSR